VNRTPSLATRAFLFAFLPLVLALVGSFIAINKAVEKRIKGELHESLHRTDMTLSKWKGEYNQHRLRILSVLADSPSLKAGIGLLRETRDPDLQEQANETVAGQLAQMGESLDCDLLFIENESAKPIVGVIGPDRSRLRLPADSMDFIGPSLIRVRNTLYEAASAPINLGSENLGRLIVGRKFNIHAWSEIGDAALIRNGKVILTTFPQETANQVGQQLQTRCSARAEECEIELAGENFLALPVRQDSLGNDIRLVSFQSIDAASNAFTKSIRGVFPLIGAGGVLLVFVFSLVGSRYIAKPLVTLIGQLQRDGKSGSFSTEVAGNYRAAEVNELAMQFSRAADAVKESERRLDEATEEFIESMAHAQDARDPYTSGHSERVSVNSTAIARVMGLSPEQIEIIRIGAKLHDLGKIGIPDAVLRKPGKLSAEEYRLIQQHPLIGKKILEKVGRFKDFLPIVELHHENPDGSGYPYGLREDEIPIGVRIVHVADVYDAITSDRAYRQGMSEAKAWDLLIKGMGTLFDPEVIDALWSMVQKQQGDGENSKTANVHVNDFAYYSLRGA
jgi:HD domain-containing protein